MAVAIPLVFGIGGKMLGGYIAGQVGAMIGGMAGVYIGSVMFPSETEKPSVPKIDSFPVQTTLSGSPIPIVKGTRRVAGTIIYLGELKSYVISSSSGGGGKGFGGGNEVTTHERRYKRSFLIAICEGPATVGKMWKGDQPILTSECTIFEGDGNTGLATTVGVEFGHWKHLCCAWFEDYDLGTTPAVPQFTFEVGSDTSFRICDLVAGGGSFQISGDWSCAEMANISGDFSHIMVEGLYSGKQVNRIDRLSNGDFVFIGYATGSGPFVTRIKEDGTVVWATSPSPGLLGNDIFVDSSDYIYIALGPQYPFSCGRLRKLNPADGATEWTTLYSNIDSLSGIIQRGTKLYALSETDYIFRVNLSAGGIDWTSAPKPNIAGRIGAVGGYVFTHGTYGGKPAVWGIPTDLSGYEGLVSDAYHQFSNGTTYGGLLAVDLDGTTYVYVGIATATGGYVAMLQFTPASDNLSPPPTYIDPSFTLIATYDLGAAPYDIKRDIDGGLLVAHDRGTGANGETGHVTKLNLDLSYGNGFVDFDNDRGGFVRALMRGSGTVIGDNSNIATINPVEAMVDIMVDQRCGGGVNSSLISFSDYNTAYEYCYDNSIGVAIVLDAQRPMLDWMDFIQSHYFGYTRLG